MSWIGRRMGEGGRYTLVQELGTGAMGMVFLAEDSRLSRRVVIKILSPTLTGNPRIRERFHNEAKIQANLEHAHIVRALDSLEDEGHLAIVMEYAQGPDLESALAEAGGRLTFDQAFAVLDPVMDAIQFAHTMGIVHRDLKPSNILLDRKTGAEVPKVADFGIAKIVGQEGGGKTREGAVIGTPSYMPPEQLRGAHDLDHRADVYALGAIMYQLVTGRMPLGEGSEYEITHRALSGMRPQSAAEHVPGLPPAFDAVVARAMEGDRAVRYQTVAALRQDLRDIKEGRPPRGAAAAPAGPPATSTMAPAGAPGPQTQDWNAGAARAAPTVFEAPEATPAAARPGGAPTIFEAGHEGTLAGPSPAPQSTQSNERPGGTTSHAESRASSLRTTVLGVGVAAACLVAVAIVLLLRGDPEPSASGGDDPAASGADGAPPNAGAAAPSEATAGNNPMRSSAPSSHATPGSTQDLPNPPSAEIASIGEPLIAPGGHATPTATVDHAADVRVAERTTVAPGTLPSTPFTPGNYWIYRRERSGSGKSDDECSSELYYVKRWVDSVQDEFEAKLVTLRETGGASDTKERVFRYSVDSSCVRFIQSNGMTLDLYCLSPGPLTPLTIAGMPFRTQQSWASGHDAIFDPWLGRVKDVTSDEHGRRTVEEVVGYQVAGERAGEYSMQPTVCDWDQSEKLKPNRPLQLPLSRREGFASIRASTGPYGSTGEVIRNNGSSESFPSGLPMVRAKGWATPDGDSEVVLFQYNGGTYEQFLILRLRDGSILERSTLSFQKPPKKVVDALMLSHGNECYLRARFRSGPTTCRAADFTLQGPWLKRFGGTLN